MRVHHHTHVLQYDVWFLHFKNGTDGKGAVEHDGQLNDPHRDTTYHEPVCDKSFSPPKCSPLCESVSMFVHDSLS